MVVAKTDAAHRALCAQFANKTESGIERGYLALVWGAPGRPKGTIDAPLDRHPQARDKRAVREGGRQAVTHWQVLERFAGTDGKPVASLLACTLETGRTHQIRVHLAHIGHPILGDASYGTGFKTKASLLSPDGARRPGGSWTDRPCMLIYWLSNTPNQEKACGSNRNCRAICGVYVMPWLRKAATRGRNGRNRLISNNGLVNNTGVTAT